MTAHQVGEIASEPARGGGERGLGAVAAATAYTRSHARPTEYTLAPGKGAQMTPPGSTGQHAARHGPLMDPCGVVDHMRGRGVLAHQKSPVQATRVKPAATRSHRNRSGWNKPSCS